jgi:hypothetical protein
MTYLVPNDFRTATLNEVCQGVSLTLGAPDNVTDAMLTAAIARFTQRIDQYTHDHFETQSTALDHDVYVQSRILYLNKRCTSAGTVKTRDHTGTLTTQAATAYRLHSSLDAAGAVKQGELDYLELLPWGTGLTGPDMFWSWVWPYGPSTVQVGGTFGWSVTPGDIKRALALLVWDHFANARGDLQRATSYQDAGKRIEYQNSTGLTGIPEADDILMAYRWEKMAGIA